MSVTPRQRYKSRLILTLGILLLPALVPALALASLPASRSAVHHAALPQIHDAQIVHLLNRLAFGPTPGAIDYVRRIGIDRYIDDQLHPATLPPNPDLAARLRALPDLQASLTDLARQYQPPSNKKDLSDEERKALNEGYNAVLKQAMLAKMLRAVESPAQLQEVMTDFWYNHFNVFADKASEVKIFAGAYERDAIRPYALGKFGDLLQGTARHPAMLIYLDNWLNTDPDSVAARGRKTGINENYAREVMELHTLGVDGGYSQSDVSTLAHILTGWGLAQGPGWIPRATFMFDPRRHDAGDMLLLGHEVKGGGEDEVTDVLNLLARQPATAHHIAYQLAQNFVADNPPKGLVTQLTAVYMKTDGDIAAMLRVLFHSPAFWDAANSQNKFKPPFRYVVSALRAAGLVPQGDGQLAYSAVAQMGEPLYRCLTPNGYANASESWLNSDALLKRIEFARGLSRFSSPSAEPSETIIESFGTSWSANSIVTIRSGEPKQRPVLALSSPEFVYY